MGDFVNVACDDDVSIFTEVALEEQVSLQVRGEISINRWHSAGFRRPDRSDKSDICFL